MSNSGAAGIEIVNRDVWPVFANSANQDMCIYTETDAQAVLFGTGGAAAAVGTLKVAAAAAAGVEVCGNVMPGEDRVWDLGASNLRFSRVFVNSNSGVDIGGVRLLQLQQGEGVAVQNAAAVVAKQLVIEDCVVTAGAAGIHVTAAPAAVSAGMGVTLNGRPLLGPLSIDDTDAITIGESNVSVLNTTRVEATGWAASVDGGGNDYGRGVALDADGNIYMAGFYSAAAVVYNADGSASAGVSLRAPTGLNAAFVIKFSPAGTALWAVSVDGSAGDAGYTVAVDGVGDVYLAGLYESTSVTAVYNTGNVASGSVTLRAPTGLGAYVVKWNASGTAQWAVSVDGSSGDGAFSLAVDRMGNTFLSGYYSGTGQATVYNAGNVASGAVSLRAADAAGAAFLVKWNAAGIAQWAASLDGTGTQNGQAVAVDATGNVYLAGDYTNGAGVYNANNVASAFSLPIPSGPAGTRAAYLVKYNADGTALWFGRVDGSGEEHATAVAVDPGDGSVYLGGYYLGLSGPGQSVSVFSASNVQSTVTLRAPSGGSATSAAYVVKYDAASGMAQWGACVDGGSSGTSSGFSVATDTLGNVYLAGSYAAVGAGPTVYSGSGFDGGFTLPGLPATAAISNAAAFVLKFDGAGVPQWGARVDGVGADEGRSVVVDAIGNVFLGGWYSGGAASIYDISGTAASPLRPPTAGGAAAFAVKFSSAYRLMSNLTASAAGKKKYLLNASGRTAVVDIKDASTGSTIQTMTLAPGACRRLVWYGNAWFVVR